MVGEWLWIQLVSLNSTQKDFEVSVKWLSTTSRKWVQWCNELILLGKTENPTCFSSFCCSCLRANSLNATFLFLIFVSFSSCLFLFSVATCILWSRWASFSNTYWKHKSPSDRQCEKMNVLCKTLSKRSWLKAVLFSTSQWQFCYCHWCFGYEQYFSGAIILLNSSFT